MRNFSQNLPLFSFPDLLNVCVLEVAHTFYTDQFHPITANAREELNAAVLEAYEQKLEQSDILDEDEELPCGPSM